MVVRLDLEGANPAFANINDAGILAWALYHYFRARGQPLQVNFGRFVRAVLAPHHAEDSELRQRGRAAQCFQDFLVFLLRKPMFAEQLRSDFNSLLSGRHGGKFYFRTSNKFFSLGAGYFRRRASASRSAARAGAMCCAAASASICRTVS